MAPNSGRAERCLLLKARYLVPTIVGTIRRWLCPGQAIAWPGARPACLLAGQQREGSCRRAFARRVWCRQSAALYGRPTGRLKMGGGVWHPPNGGCKGCRMAPFHCPANRPGRSPPGNRRAARCPAEFRRMSCGAGRALDRRAKARRNGAANRRHGFRPPGRAAGAGRENVPAGLRLVSPAGHADFAGSARGTGRHVCGWVRACG